ncbi:MAG: PCYCGC domain-containing protein [Bryobacterales bacterium]|nr:PCYCGC domain-containing protein [Bryobacterales bacterium]
MNQRRKEALRRKRRIRRILALSSLAVVVGIVTYSSVAPQGPARSHVAPGATPPYEVSPEAASLPTTMSPESFTDPAAIAAYRIVGEIPEVVAQQPCYCRCDRLGHGSLHDCYVTDHAAT